MTPPTTSGSIRDSVTTPTSTTSSPRHADVACGSCSTACSTTSAPTSLATRKPLAGGDDTWFRKRRKGFDTFEGHDGLITLNHDNPDVVDYVVDVMSHWLRRGADGWRLDAAYAVPDQFWAQVLPRVRESFPDAWFVGEVIHGDYAGIVRAATFDSVTQYELWKAIWSSLNDGNFHELDHALRRHDEFLDTFVPMTFVGNHDVTRIASQLDDAAARRARAGPAAHHRWRHRASTRATSGRTAASRRNASEATTPYGRSSPRARRTSEHLGRRTPSGCTSI